MHKSLGLAVLLLLVAGTASAQDYATVETSPAFMYIHTPSIFKGSNSINCIGGGGTLAYNFSKLIGLAADLGGCKVLNDNNTILANVINGSEFTFLFGPRFTFRNSSKFQPFFEVNAGGMRLSLSCQNNAVNCNIATNGNSYARTAFAMTAGGGFDIKLSPKFAIRLVQAEYLYTRFGNNCNGLPICSGNNSQNSFRLKSGIVIGWGAGSK
jgi:opacity protein-like surface antigen